VCAHLTPGHIWTANIGDSRCVLARTTGKNSVKATELTTDHTIENEEDRIESSPGGEGKVVLNKSCDLRVASNDGGRLLAMGRSIGDRQYKPYVSDTPDIVPHERDPTDKFLILASDGVWEWMQSNQEACNIVNERFPNLQAGVDDLVAVSKARWEEETAGEYMYRDDITAVVVNLEGWSPP